MKNFKNFVLGFQILYMLKKDVKGGYAKNF